MPAPPLISQTTKMHLTSTALLLPSNHPAPNNTEPDNIIVSDLPHMTTQGSSRFLDAINRFFDALAHYLTKRRRKRLDVRVMNDRQLADVGLSRNDFTVPSKNHHPGIFI